MLFLGVLISVAVFWFRNHPCPEMIGNLIPCHTFRYKQGPSAAVLKIPSPATQIHIETQMRNYSQVLDLKLQFKLQVRIFCK